jgi:hypothetical protein
MDPVVNRAKVSRPKKSLKNYGLVSTEAVRLEREISNEGGKNWIMPKEINANRFFWGSHSVET